MLGMLTNNQTPPRPPVQVKEIRSGKTIYAYIIGDSAEVEETLRKYLRDYAFAGYQTQVVSEKSENGTKTIKLRRYDSCE